MREARAQIVGVVCAVEADLRGTMDAEEYHEMANYTYRELHIVNDNFVRWVGTVHMDMIHVWPDDRNAVWKAYTSDGNTDEHTFIAQTPAEAFALAWASLAEGHGINETMVRVGIEIGAMS